MKKPTQSGLVATSWGPPARTVTGPYLALTGYVLVGISVIRDSASMVNNTQNNHYSHSQNRPLQSCLVHTHTGKHTHTHPCLAAAETTERGCREREKGKPTERQITGLDKLHFDCDHESRLVVCLVFSSLTTAAREPWSLIRQQVSYWFSKIICGEILGEITAWVKLDLSLALLGGLEA